MNDSMSSTLPDEAALFFYKHIIVPWETKLKNEVGCWDVKRTREALEGIAVQINCVEIGRVESTVENEHAAAQGNFVVFSSQRSQMKDLFRHLRNCVAHCSVSVVRSRKRVTRYRFSGTEYRRPALSISAALDLDTLRLIVEALPTKPSAAA